MGVELTKVTQLRNNEYYCMQETFDFLYKKSYEGYVFDNLIPFIISDNNLRLSYRNIKTNKGSKTNGLSGKNMSFIAKMKLGVYIRLTKNSINDYSPSKVRRASIPKSNGKVRYLGIKEPIDKIIEQGIYQILEAILTAKFHNNSNGFIKGRSQKRAIAQFNNYIRKDKLYFVIDLDIKGFFDNVNHGKLLKQLWSCGVRDKNLLSIISKMLKAEVFNVGIPNKGTPQGGILSPLLANLVLNEFDWWLESKSSLGIKFVRYADDVKILCPSYAIARYMLDKIIKWLNERLKLEVSEEKTKIINLKRNYSYFLGFKIKVKEKNGKIKIVSHMTEKAIENTKIKVKKEIRELKKASTDKKKCNEVLELYNSIVRGVHNYYNTATHINEDLHNLQWHTKRYIKTKLKNVLSFGDVKDNITKEVIGKVPKIRGKPLLEIGEVTHEPPRYRGDKINYFEANSRKCFHKDLAIDNIFIMEMLLKTPKLHESVEFNDNVLSKFCGQLGNYAITNEMMFDLNNIRTIRINENGTDKYHNIIIVDKETEKLLRLKEVDDIIEMSNLKRGIKREQLDKINKLRKENSLPLIS